MSEAPRDERRLMTDWIQEKSPFVLVLIDGDRYLVGQPLASSRTIAGLIAS